MSAYGFGVRLALADAGLKKLGSGTVSESEAKAVGERIGIDWSKAKFPVSQLQAGIPIEREHGPKLGKGTNVIGDSDEKAARIAWAHLKEIPDYYTRLEKMEREAHRQEKT